MTLSNSVSLVLGFTFVAIAGINVWLILQASVKTKEAKTSSRLLYAHRVGGYIFVALFCVMAYFMFSRLQSTAGGAPPMTALHLILAMILAPLVFVKVLIARYYKNHYGLLMPIGLTIFVLSFVLIAATAGPYLTRDTKMENVSLEEIAQPPVQIDLNQAAATMQQRCSRCHNLDRVVSAVKDAPGWLKTVRRMQALPGSGISDEEAMTIVSYLTSQAAPHGPGPEPGMKVARALVDQRCGRCHSLDRVYQNEKTPEAWRATVTRMVSYAAGSTGAFQPGEDKQIIDFLSATQTAEAVSQRKAQAASAAAAGQSLVAAKAPAPAPARPQPRSSRYTNPTTIFIACVGLGMLALILHRPKRSQTPSPAQRKLVPKTTTNGTRPVKSPAPLLLQLVRITQQTPDSRTLRFAIANGSQFSARPGQFLSFSFLFDGKKVLRCYSICSSPARTGYIEITPKRVDQGCVSVFLNDRASVGLTVEANGPLGTFCFDESRHKKIVLVGAGSGITPLMAMLRYIDDMGLSTQVTLLYCVRTRHDVIFQAELDELQTRLNGFKYHVLLSKPEPGWQGWSGHISREFIADTVQDVQEQDFFLCGPPPFMEATRSILATMGVKPERINQESFGGKAPTSVQKEAAPAEPDLAVEFARSGKVCSVRDGQSLLEAAEEHGVNIPYSCRQGQCGTCKTRLLDGDVYMDTEQGLDLDSKASGFVLLCVGHPTGSVKLDA